MSTRTSWRGLRLQFNLGWTIILVLLVVGLCPWSEASALSSNQYTVTAEVAPARFIIVDKSAHIKQLISNTAEPVTPSVLKGSIHGQPLALTADISRQYGQLISSRQSLVGIVNVSAKPINSRSFRANLSIESLLTNSVSVLRLALK